MIVFRGLISPLSLVFCECRSFTAFLRDSWFDLREYSRQQLGALPTSLPISFRRFTFKKSSRSLYFGPSSPLKYFANNIDTFGRLNLSYQRSPPFELECPNLSFRKKKNGEAKIHIWTEQITYVVDFSKNEPKSKGRLGPRHSMEKAKKAHGTLPLKRDNVSSHSFRIRWTDVG